VVEEAFFELKLEPVTRGAKRMWAQEQIGRVEGARTRYKVEEQREKDEVRSAETQSSGPLVSHAGLQIASFKGNWVYILVFQSHRLDFTSVRCDASLIEEPAR
jgi:hypothetical protein